MAVNDTEEKALLKLFYFVLQAYIITLVGGFAYICIFYGANMTATVEKVLFLALGGLLAALNPQMLANMATSKEVHEINTKECSGGENSGRFNN